MTSMFTKSLARFNDLRLAKKFTVAFGCIVAATLLVSLVLIVNTLSLRGSVEANMRAVETLDALQKYADRIDATQEAMAQLVISGDIAFAETFADSLAPVAEARDALLAVVDDDKVRGQVGEISDNFDTWKATIADRQLDYMDDPETVDIARFLEASAEKGDLVTMMDAMVREEVAAGLRDEEMVEEEMKALAAALVNLR